MSISDERLKMRTMKAITLRQDGSFIVDYRHELPLPEHPSFKNLRSRHTPTTA